MRTRPEATAAPGEIVLDGCTYRMSPLSDQDWGEFERWVRSQYIATVKDNLDGLEPAEREKCLQRAFDQAATITSTSSIWFQYVGSLRGAVKILWFGVRRNHPDLTEEAFWRMLYKEGAIEEVQGLFDQVNDLTPSSARRKKKRVSTKIQQRRKAKRPK